MKRQTLSSTVLIALVVVMGVVLWVHAGNLTPPAGPVAPTMKTLEQISNQIAALPGGSGPIKRILRGTITISKDTDPPVGSATFSPAIDPTRSVVLLADPVALDFPTCTNTLAARTGACLVSLSETQITLRVDKTTSVTGAMASFQIVEYN